MKPIFQFLLSVLAIFCGACVMDTSAMPLRQTFKTHVSGATGVLLIGAGIVSVVISMVR